MKSASSLRFFILRHGPSVWNLEGRWQGQKNPELSNEGIQMTKAWAKAVMDKGLSFAEIWASDLDRALKTAEILADKLGVAVNVDERLRERSLGEWEGLTHPEILKGWPGALERREFPPGSENDTQVKERVLEFLGEFLTARLDAESKSSQPHKTLPFLLVSHGGLITCIEEHLGADWERLSNLKGRWLACDLTGGLDSLRLEDRASYLDPDSYQKASSGLTQ